MNAQPIKEKQEEQKGINNNLKKNKDMNTQHSQGPWHYKQVGGRYFIGLVNYPTDVRTDTSAGYICEISKGIQLTKLTEQDEANARLITKAPELLQMVYDLKKCIERLTNDSLELHQEDRDKEAQWTGEAHELLISINPDYNKQG